MTTARSLSLAAALAATAPALATEAASPKAAPDRTAAPAPGGAKAGAAKAAPAGPAAATIEGGLAYTQIVRFDYDQDGTRDRVQFFVVFEGRAALGEPESPGHVPAEGTVRYVVYDHDKKKKVENWLVGFNMGFPEPGTPYPMSDLVIEGKTARFDAFNQSWTITDGGKGHAKDKVVIDDHFTKPRVGRFYDGDVKVTSPPSAAVPAGQRASAPGSPSPDR